MKTFKTGNTDNEIEGVDYEVLDVSPNWPSMFATAVHQIKAIAHRSRLSSLQIEERPK